MICSIQGKLLCLGMLLGVLSISWSGVLAQDVVTLTFQPADGLHYIETEQMTVKDTVSAEGKTETNTVSYLIKSRTTIHTSATGYLVTATSLSAGQTMNGKAQEIDPLIKTYLNVPLTIIVTPKGTAVSVSGVAKILQNSKLIPARQQAQYGYLCTNDGIIAGMKNLWDEQALHASGRSVKVGDCWTFDAHQPMADGKPITSTIFVEVKGFETVGGHKGARLHYSRIVDAEDVSRIETFMMQQMIRRQGLPQPHVEVKEQNEDGDVVLDVLTLQPLSRTITITSQAEINMGGRELNETRQESRRYRYDYGSGNLTQE